jgi:hypothetical protein
VGKPFSNSSTARERPSSPKQYRWGALSAGVATAAWGSFDFYRPPTRAHLNGHDKPRGTV